jgi:hypothetical protein
MVNAIADGVQNHNSVCRTNDLQTLLAGVSVQADAKAICSVGCSLMSCYIKYCLYLMYLIT